MKKARQAELMEVQRAISREKMAALVGQTLPVLVEGRSEESELLLRGRLAFQAPDVDGMVYIANAPDLAVGQIVELRITQAADYDVVAEPVA